jgi:hypothetical protein
VRLEGLKIEKNSLTSSGLEPATFRLVAWRFNHYATACQDWGFGMSMVTMTIMMTEHMLGKLCCMGAKHCTLLSDKIVHYTCLKRTGKHLGLIKFKYVINSKSLAEIKS